MSDKRLEHMTALNARRKQDTLAKIRDAVDMLRETGAKVTRKALIDETGLSSATFSKPYVKELLKELKVLQFEDRTAVKAGIDIKKLIRENREKDAEIARLKQQKDSIAAKMNTLQLKIEERDEAIKQYEHEEMVLRGQVQSLLEQLVADQHDIKTINLSEARNGIKH